MTSPLTVIKCFHNSLCSLDYLQHCSALHVFYAFSVACKTVKKYITALCKNQHRQEKSPSHTQSAEIHNLQRILKNAILFCLSLQQYSVLYSTGCHRYTSYCYGYKVMLLRIPAIHGTKTTKNHTPLVLFA